MAATHPLERHPHRRARLAAVALASLFVALLPASCTKGAPPASLLDGGGAAIVTETVTSTSTSASASISAAPSVDAGAEPQVDELQARAKKLFDAIVTDEPDVATDLLYPHDAYVAMKDVKDPAAAWEKLAKDYKAQIHAYHKRLGKHPADATFDKLELNTKTQIYVAPKKELNKTGYNRVARSKLRYTIKGKAKSFDLAVMIDADGKWYVLHVRQ